MQEEQDDEEKELEGLKGLKVKHSANELLEGETMILTLADKNILDDKGELDDEEQDELENVLAVRPSPSLVYTALLGLYQGPCWPVHKCKLLCTNLPSSSVAIESTYLGHAAALAFFGFWSAVDSSSPH